MSEWLPFQIFRAFFTIGFISFGGVVGVLPVLEKMVVVDHQWLTHDAFMSSYVLAQFVPGPNVALCPMLGYRIAGWPGFAAGLLGIYSPPLLLMSATHALHRRFRERAWMKRGERALRPLILGLLLSSAAQIGWAQSSTAAAHPWLLRGVALGVIAAGYAVLLQRKAHPLWVILASGAAWAAANALQA
jgi:chromate transporter